MRIAIEGDLSVVIGVNTSRQLILELESKFAVDHNYCPQTRSFRLRSLERLATTRLNFNFPIHCELRRLSIFNAKVVLENIDAAQLDIDVHGPRANLVLRGNTFVALNVESFARNTIDMSLQSLPEQFSHRVAKGTQLKMPNQGPPTCVVCYENEITQMFTGCGHWCLCRNCASVARCPICRQESAQIRILQAAAHHC